MQSRAPGPAAPAGPSEYEALLAKIDAFDARVQALQRQFLRCGRGCDACCRTARSAWAVEVAHVRAFVAGLPDARREALDARRGDAEVRAGRRCVFLDDDGACGVYEARPVICRTHGPLVVRRDTGPVWCALNFAGLDPATVPDQVPPEGVLDLDRLDALLSIVNRRHVAVHGGPERQPLESALWPE